MLLVGTKVYLRCLQKKDLERTLSWINDPDIMDNIGVRGPRTHEQQLRWFESLQDDNTKIVFSICIRDNDTHIGNVALDQIDTINRNCRLSIFIGNIQQRGNGYGFEATKLAIEYGFFYLNLHKIYCKTNATNEAALRMYKKLGFKQEGLLRKHEYKQGEYVDKIMFGLLKADYLVLNRQTGEGYQGE